MPAHHTVKLNTDAVMPALGLGTWKSEPGKVSKAVEVAIKHGYRHVDAAAAYGNEKEVGDGLHAGLKAAGIERKDIFLTTKLNNNDHGHPLKALNASLEKLQTPYVDLWLMHWPAPMTADLKGADKSLDWVDTYKKMEQIYQTHPEKVKAIGLSNTMVTYLERLLKETKVVPAVNQVESHPSCPQEDVVDFCRKHGIVVTAYSPLGSDGSNLHDNPIVKEIAEKHGVSTANVLISLQVNRPGVTVISKSVTEKRIVDNLKIIDLSDEEVRKLLDIHKTDSFRVCKPQWTGWGNLGFPDQ